MVPVLSRHLYRRPVGPLSFSMTLQNLSRRALNRHTVSTSTTVLGRLFQILTISAEKEYLRKS